MNCQKARVHLQTAQVQIQKRLSVLVLYRLVPAAPGDFSHVLVMKNYITIHVKTH